LNSHAKKRDWPSLSNCATISAFGGPEAAEPAAALKKNRSTLQYRTSGFSDISRSHRLEKDLSIFENSNQVPTNTTSHHTNHVFGSQTIGARRFPRKTSGI
jgi:hypothetical protein